ncbi:MAG: transcriptional repressor, partial [Oscillospiraceae bacterium]|nr:transcriptional repressor [Candidatus Equicaccousia limihippi]
SAETVYECLKPRFPDLSLGTVYRDIETLLKQGEICSVGVVNGKERFDGTTAPHAHAICKGCGRVIDLQNPELLGRLCKTINDDSGFTVEYPQLRFFGLCKDCAKKNK